MAAARRLDVICNHLNYADTQENYHAQTNTCSAQSFRLLEGQVAIITGSGRGIGAEAAKLFAKHGAKVVVTDLDGAKSQEICDEIIKSGGESLNVPGNVTDPTFPEHIVKSTLDKYGKVNILVNNAGYTWDGVIHKMTDQQWDAMLYVHNTAPFRLIRALSTHFRESAKADIDKHGRPIENRVIINISSTSGIHGNFGQINYSTAKMGVVGLTKTVAKEWGAFGIRCNAIAFGFIETRLTQNKALGEYIEVDGKKVALGIPDAGKKENKYENIPLARPGKPEEAASSILLLASPLASYISGHTLEVTGGMGI